ncbi:DUF4834 family protein [Zunongwangia sp. F363]|uniref:DUF4834 family protein n=1 Tax=Autumnicola tepida TaxID=3075595 RepID=A0ABU3CCI2_9FLAO|nr:DUF4834 family protein [Zunongwangia sp. F363]MDT0644021.1 DUF4834 family protein [Zunongwangia sp. F363]
MYEASFSGILRTILIIMLVYFGIKILFRFFGPLILKYFMKKMGKKFQDQFSQFQQPQQEKEGKVSIDKKPRRGRKSNKNVGEYIDYEEID